MNLEALPNELLLQLFRRLDVINLFRTFRGLNQRFDQLVSQSCSHNQLDFRAVPKHEFDAFCHQDLPLIADHLQVLHLSNDDRTPNLPSILFSYRFTLVSFQRLRVLSLCSIDTIDALVEIVSQCLHLSSLVRLSMLNCYFLFDSEEIRCLLNQIWRLPKLTHWTFDRSLSGGEWLEELSTVSSSIRHISMENVACNLNELSHLLQFTPHLRHLAVTLSLDDDADEEQKHSIPSIVSLTCTFQCSATSIQSFLKKLPHLSCLTLNTETIYLDGFQWETLLVEAVPNLKVFHLRMNFRLQSVSKSDEEVEKLLDSFRSPFWLEKHRRFVQCYWNPSLEASLYTLPHIFEKFTYSNNYCSKSTYPEAETACSSDVTMRIHSPFDHVKHLELSLPIDEQFGRIFKNLQRSRTLFVKLPRGKCDYSQLQMILDQATSLASLTVGMDGWVPLANEIFQLKCPSIREIRFINKTKFICQYLNSEEYEGFISSDLCLQCHSVMMRVEHRRNIIRLIEAMPHLQSFIVQSEDDELNPLFPSDADELVQWLQTHLPSTCSVTRDTHTSNIRLWLDRAAVAEKTLLSSN